MTIDCYTLETMMQCVVLLVKAGIGFKADADRCLIKLTGAH